MQEVFEKIVEELRNYIKNVDVIYETNENYNGAGGFVKAIEIVKQVAAEYNNGWIPADEPPGTDDYILLSFENFSLPSVGRYEEHEDGGAYYIGDENETCISQDLIVNAWQPLPEPYKKGESEKRRYDCDMNCRNCEHQAECDEFSL